MEKQYNVSQDIIAEEHYLEDCMELRSRLLQELYNYNSLGVNITLEGESRELYDVANICALAERGCYHGEKIYDEIGKLKEIKFTALKSYADIRT